MPSQNEFSALLLRVRGGDSDAATELVNRYGSAIRVAVRTRLSDPRLRRQFDSADVCQSVLASFFLHAAAGSFDLREPKQLAALLAKMARNKVAMRMRTQYRQCRDARRTASGGLDASLADAAPGPARHAEGKELLDRALNMMSPEIRQVAARRIQGEPWSDIASSLGGTAEGRRKQYERAIERIADTLDMESLGG